MSDASIEAIAARYGGQVRESRAHFEVGGLRMRAVVGVSSGQPDELIVTVVLGPLPRILLRREIDSDRTAKRWRLVSEVQLGDAAFDDRVYIDARAQDDAVRHVLARPEARAAVLALLRETYEIRMDDAGLAFVLPGADPIDLDRCVRAIEAATTLARTLPPDAARWVTRGSEIGRSIANAAMVAGILVSVATMIVGAFAWSSWGPVDTFTMLALGFALSIALWSGPAIFLFVAIRGRSDALTLLPIALVTSFVFALPFGPTGLVIANATLDASPVVEQVLEPLEWHMGESDGDPYVWVRFRSFRDPDESLDLRFDGALEPTAHARVHLFTRAGALGFAWIANARLDY